MSELQILAHFVWTHPSATPQSRPPLRSSTLFLKERGRRQSKAWQLHWNRGLCKHSPLCMSHTRRVAPWDPIGRLCRTWVQRMVDMWPWRLYAHQLGKRGRQREKENWKRRVGGRPEEGREEGKKSRWERRGLKLRGLEDGWRVEDATPHHSRCEGNPSPQLANNG